LAAGSWPTSRAPPSGAGCPKTPSGCGVTAPGWSLATVTSVLRPAGSCTLYAPEWD
jgi:hypothetical protein